MKGQLTTGFGSSPISLRDGSGAIFRRRGLVVFTFLAVVTGTVAVTLLQPNRYDSRMKILVKNQRVDVAITPEATTGLNAPTVDNDVSENQINSEIELHQRVNRRKCHCRADSRRTGDDRCVRRSRDASCPAYS